MATEGQGDLKTRGKGEGRRGDKMKIGTHRDLEVYQMGFDAAMQIFQLTKGFPKEEIYALTDQVRRSSRSVCSSVAEAWRKRRYRAAFISKLNDAEAEAAETQVWLEFSVKCGYLDATIGHDLEASYDIILGKLVTMILRPEQWILER